MVEHLPHHPKAVGSSLAGKEKKAKQTTGAYPRVEHLKGVTTLKHYSRLKRLATRDKLSSLLQTFVNYGCKKFYNIGPCPQELTISTISSHICFA